MSRNARFQLPRLFGFTLLLMTLGCGQGAGGNTDGGDAGGSESAAAPRILAPFQGRWRFSLEKTLANWEAGGATAKDIAEAKELAKMFPLHPDMIVENDGAVLAGLVEGEYQFFALHPHGQWVCGKAWHHEDRHDPGDMSKSFVRLEVRDADLQLSMRIDENSLDLADPDLIAMPLTAGSAESCEADSAPNPPWSAWQTYVFERGEAPGG